MDVLSLSSFGIFSLGTALGMAAGYYLCHRRFPSLPKGIARVLQGKNQVGANVGLYYFDPVTRKEFLSPSLLALLGVSPAITDFASLASRLPEESGELLQRTHRQLLQGASPVNFSLKLEKSFLHGYGYRIDSDKGKGLGILLWLHDDTEILSTLQQLHREYARYKSEAHHYATILNACPYPIWQRDNNLQLRYVNNAYHLLVEAPHHDTIPELTQHSADIARTAISTDTAQTDEKAIIVSGQRRLFEIREIPAGQGATAGFAYDVTSRDELQNELSRHISAQSDLLESISSAMAVYGPNTRLKFFNQAFVKLWELDEKWLHSKPKYTEILDILRQKRKLPEQADFRSYKQQQLQLFTGLLEPHNDFLYLPEGTTLRVLVIPHALGGLLFAYEDMTDRLALERSYNTLLAVKRATLDNLHEGVAVFGQDGRLKLSNPVYQRLWGFTAEDLEGEPHISELLEKNRHLYHYTGAWEEFKKMVVAQTTRREHTHLHLTRTDEKVLDCTAVPLPDGETLMTYIDITDSHLLEKSLRERNEALETADRLKTEFLANVSYELRSPLTSIIGFTEMFQQRYAGTLEPRQQEYLQDIHHSSIHLMALINNILELASIQAGYTRLDVSTFSILHLLKMVLKLFQERAHEKAVTLELDCPADIGMMNGDETRLKQALFNLLSNAVKFSLPGGKVTLGARQEEGSTIALWVADQGIGIAASEQPDIFERFHKTNSNKTLPEQGAGLGLTIVKTFIELHGGSIVLESTEGKGTIVTCYLKR